MKSPKKLYRYHVANLQAIDQAMERIARSLREAISKGEESTVSSFMRLYAFLLGAWAECRLRKLVYEPLGFGDLERGKIFAVDTQLGQWQIAIEIAFRKQYKIQHAPLTKDYLPHSVFSRYETLLEMLKKELQPIIELRNKLAHGQWIYTLNSEGDDIAQAQMDTLRAENLLSLQFKKNLISSLSSVIHDLVVSKPTFERDFDNHFRTIIETQRNLKHRNYNDYAEKMRQKYQRGKFRRAFVPTTVLAKAVKFDDEMMHVSLTDGRIISVPIIWFPLLHEATSAQRKRYEIGGGGVSLHWPEIDEDLSIAGLMAGADWEAA